MNSAWKQTLPDKNATFSSDQRIIFNSPAQPTQNNFIYPLSQFAILRASGPDATAFLQGQTTCNLNDLTAQNSRFGAFCNAKGRVISTFLILKTAQEWLLMLPTELLPDLQKRLQRYILRANVQLTDCSEDYGILGLSHVDPAHLPFNLPSEHLATLLQPTLMLRLGKYEPRYLLITTSVTTQQHWSDLILRDFIPQSASEWDRLDIQSGIPWLCNSTTEEYIPQMLNLDQLGGISFNKGCYTGQEIVARTHYLGKAKRTMFTAVAETTEAPALNSAIIDATNGQSVGTVLATHVHNNRCTLLVVLTAEAQHLATLALHDQPSAFLTVL
jgi:folate-binding protein YgfZ